MTPGDYSNSQTSRFGRTASTLGRQRERKSYSIRRMRDGTQPGATRIVFAPATVANVAVGFDILGFALQGVGDRVTVARTERPGVTVRRILGIVTKLPTDPRKNTAGVAVQALLDAPDRATWTGRRDVTWLVLAIQTGLRISELVNLVRDDVALGTGRNADRLCRLLYRQNLDLACRASTLAEYKRNQRV